jgi:hypothetical protein
LYEKQEFLHRRVAKVTTLPWRATPGQNFLQTFTFFSLSIWAGLRQTQRVASVVVKLFRFVRVRITEILSGHLTKQRHLSGSNSIKFPGGKNP